MLEKMAIDIEELSYEVNRSVEGSLASEQIKVIAELLEGYKNGNNPLTPERSHYDQLRNVKFFDRVCRKVLYKRLLSV